MVPPLVTCRTSHDVTCRIINWRRKKKISPPPRSRLPDSAPAAASRRQPLDAPLPGGPAAPSRPPQPRRRPAGAPDTRAPVQASAHGTAVAAEWCLVTSDLEFYEDIPILRVLPASVEVTTGRLAVARVNEEHPWQLNLA